ncbi:MAG: lipopolysaccharide heptosyltransferase II [Phycisphaerales bacterium]|nr:lipopolysaccharide heptosyltransferase II [Phycisphaerales bacterium]
MKILIIKPTALGDVATTLPLLCDLKAICPDATIDWLVHPAYAALLQGHDAIGEVITFDRKKLAAWWYRPTAFRAFVKLIKTLRAKKYDVVIDAQGLFRSGFLTWITGAKMRVGFAHAREGASLAYTHKVTLPERGKKMLAVDRMRKLGTAVEMYWGGDGDGGNGGQWPVFQVPVGIQHSALSIPGEVVVVPGARWDTKRWEVERFAEIVKRLVTQGRYVTLLGSPDERPLCEELERMVAGGERVLNLAGQTSMTEMIGVLASAGLVVANDSGPLHVAVALGKRIVAIYGPTSPEFVGPYGQMENVLRRDGLTCHPCRRRTCDHHACMKEVTVEMVWEKVKRSF